MTINLTKDLFSSSWYKKTDALDENICAPTEKDTADLKDALDKLPQKYRTVIHLHYYEGYRIEEIADITRATQGTVKSQLHRARQMLKEILGEGETVGE